MAGTIGTAAAGCQYPQVATTPTKSNTTTIVAAAVIVVLLIIGLVWYFGYYDTSAGRCNRGDLGACLIYYAQSQASASAQAAADQASANAQAAAAAQSGFAANGCTVGPGDGSHEALALARPDRIGSTAFPGPYCGEHHPVPLAAVTNDIDEQHPDSLSGPC